MDNYIYWHFWFLRFHFGGKFGIMIGGSIFPPLSYDPTGARGVGITETMMVMWQREISGDVITRNARKCSYPYYSPLLYKIY